MKRPVRILIALAIVIGVITVWLGYRYDHGRLIAVAASRHYVCGVRERPSAQSVERYIAQFLHIGTGTQVYLCQISYPSGPITSCAFTFAGSFQASRGDITIHETEPDEDTPNDGHVIFDIDGYQTRCDFRVGGSAHWTRR